MAGKGCAAARLVAEHNRAFRLVLGLADPESFGQVDQLLEKLTRKIGMEGKVGVRQTKNVGKPPESRLRKKIVWACAIRR